MSAATPMFIIWDHSEIGEVYWSIYGWTHDADLASVFSDHVKAVEILERERAGRPHAELGEVES